MTVLRSAAFGCALALTAASAYAQSVVTRQIDNEPVETTVTQTPTGTVITRRPVAPAAAPAPVYGTYGAVAPRPYVAPAAPLYPAPTAGAATTALDETVGLAPSGVRTVTARRPAETRVSEQTTTRIPRVRHRARQMTGSLTTARTVHRMTRRVAARPLVLSPAERNVVYRTVVQQQVVPAPVAPAGYPPFPAPAYRPRTVMVAPSATTGYGWTAPATDIDEDYVETVPAVAPYPRYTAPRYAVGSVLPTSVVVTPLPTTAAVRVPAVQPYSYATVDGRVLLVDPVTDTVVADITP